MTAGPGPRAGEEGGRPPAPARRGPPFAPRDLALAGGMLLLGAAIRWPHLQAIPRFTDEWEEVQVALKIARQGARPLVSIIDPYNGPLFHYLMAPGFALGAGLAWPRLLAWLFGSLAVAATYFLGASMAGLWMAPAAGEDRAAEPRRARLAGLIAAALMAVSFVPVVVNSHIAWSNSSTPFWTTLFLLALVEARRRERPAWLLAAGVLGGLAQQTHPSALAILLGGAGWVLLTRPRWLGTRWPWLGLLAAAILVANLAVFNLVTGGGSLEGAARRDYAFTGLASLDGFAANLRGFARLAWQMVGSTFLAGLDETADPAALRRALLGPGALLYGLCALAALAATARRAGIALAVWLAAMVVLPLFNQAYHHFILARYLAPLLPPSFAAMGCLLAAGLLPASGARGRRRARAGATALLLAALLAYPLGRLARFYRAEREAGRHNARLWQIVPALAPLADENSPLGLDRELRFQRLTAGGNLLNVIDGMLDAQATPNDRLRLEEIAELPAGSLVVLGGAQAAALSATRRIEPLDFGLPLAPAEPGDYAVYRLLGRIPDP